MRGHAVANGLPVIAVNRVGHEPDPSEQTQGIQFWGSSFVAGPQGEYSIALVTTMRTVLFSASTSTIARMYAVGGLSYVTDESMSMEK